MNSSSGLRSNGAGGITSTIRDLSKYSSMLIQEGRWKNKRIISESSYQKMLSSGMELPKIKSDYHYSLGWEVMTRNNKVDSYYKTVRWYGSASGIQVFPDQKVAFIYLCNPPDPLSTNFIKWRSRLTENLRNLLRKITSDPKLCTYWPKVPIDILKSYAGSYVNNDSGEVV